MKTMELTSSLEKVVEGINEVSNVVKSTMGGSGKVILIGDDAKFRFTKDGISVAENIHLQDPLKSLGAKIVVSSSKKTVNAVGDGTTATAVLLKHMVNGAIPYLKDTLVINDIISGMEHAARLFSDAITTQAIPVTDTSQIESIATTASNDPRLGRIIREVYDKVGLKSQVNLERSSYYEETYHEIVSGIEFETGYVHSVFITDKSTAQCIFDDPYVHVHEDPISSLTPDLEKLMNTCVNNAVPLLIIAPRFSDGFIRLCAMNKNSSRGMQICLTKSPGFGAGVKKNYADIRSFLDDDNRVERAVVSENSLILYNEDTPNLQARLDQLISLQASATEAWDERDYANRYHRLKQSVGIIYAGGVTPQARDEEYDRLEDALGSVRSAIHSGYVQGGGLALYRVRDLDLSDDLFSTPSHITGFEIVARATREPIKQILINANEAVDVILKEIEENEFSLGYNVKTKEYEDFLTSGVIDPADTIIESIKNALAGTKLLINTSYVVYNKDDTKLV